MDTGNPVLQQMNPLAYICPGGCDPVGIQSDAQFIRPKALQQILHDPFAGSRIRQLFCFKGFEFQIVIMIHQQFACGGDFLCRLPEVLHKAVEPFLCAVFFGHAAQADVFAAKDIMLADQCLYVVENTVRVAVGQDDFHALPVADFADSLRRDIADGRNLDGFVADFCNF